MLQRARGVLRANAALRLYERGQLDAALAKATEARGAFAQVSPSAVQRADLARTYQLEAEIHAQSGRAEAAIRAYVDAEELFSVDVRNRQELGRCLHDAAITLADLGL